MKTPEEIKRGMEHCKRISNSCRNCTYWVDCMATLDGRPLLKDGLAYIQQLEADNASKNERIQMLEAGLEQWHDVATSPGAVEDMARENYRLTQELEAVRRERDAAVRDLNLTTPCYVCMNNKGCPGWPRFNPCQWQWRGVCPENTEVQE